MLHTNKKQIHSTISIVSDWFYGWDVTHTVQNKTPDEHSVQNETPDISNMSTFSTVFHCPYHFWLILWLKHYDTPSIVSTEFYVWNIHTLLDVWAHWALWACWVLWTMSSLLQILSPDWVHHGWNGGLSRIPWTASWNCNSNLGPCCSWALDIQTPSQLKIWLSSHWSQV